MHAETVANAAGVKKKESEAEEERKYPEVCTSLLELLETPENLRDKLSEGPILLYYLSREQCRVHALLGESVGVKLSIVEFCKSFGTFKAAGEPVAIYWDAAKDNLLCYATFDV